MLRHGHNRKGQTTRTYYSWMCMVQRCTNEKNPAWASYGGRGITVCKRWLSFENFLKDMGVRPAGCSLDRIDNDKGYNKSNCRWATRKEQARNQSTNRVLRCRGEKRTLAEWSEIAGRKIGTVWGRLKKGLSTEEALFGPLGKAGSPEYLTQMWRPYGVGMRLVAFFRKTLLRSTG